MVGSCAEYDWRRPPARPWREDDPCRPASLYGTAKDALHRLMAAFAGQAGIGLVWARLFHLYGPHEAPARLVPSVLAALLAGQRAETGPANATRDFMHVADAGRALAHLLAGEVRGTVNVASGQPVRSARWPVLRAAGRPAGSVAVGAGFIGTRCHLADLRGCVRLVRPSMTLDRGVSALWQEMGGRGPAPPARSSGISPRRPPADYQTAASLYRAGQHDEARAAAAQVLAAEPDHHAALNLTGCCIACAAISSVPVTASNVRRARPG